MESTWIGSFEKNLKVDGVGFVQSRGADNRAREVAPAPQLLMNSNAVGNNDCTCECLIAEEGVSKIHRECKNIFLFKGNILYKKSGDN